MSVINNLAREKILDRRILLEELNAPNFVFIGRLFIQCSFNLTRRMDIGL